MTPWLAVGLTGAAGAVAVGTTPAGAVRLASLARPAPARAVASVVPVALAVVGALLVAGPVVAALLAAGGALGARALARQREVKAGAVERARALDALAILGADLRAGRAPAQALAAAASVAVGPSRAALQAAARAAGIGADVASALTSAGSAVPVVLTGLAACWQVCQRSGAGLAGAVERLEEGLRAAETQRRAVEAELAGPRATAQLLAVLPLGGLGLAAALGAHPLHVLLHTPVGLACLVGGLVLDALGLLWSRRLVVTAAPP